MRYNASFYNILVEEHLDKVLVYNTLSGAFARLDKKLYNEISTSVIDSKNPCESFNDLISEGFIKPEELNEFNLIRFNEKCAIYNNSRKRLSFVIAPTLLCNLNCEYCFEKGYKKDIKISDETLECIYSFIIKTIKFNTEIIHITWFGGEPLLEYEKIVQFSKRLILYLNGLKVKYSASIITNATLLDKERIDCLVRDCNINHMQISLDGSKDIYCKKRCTNQETYHKVINNIIYASTLLKVSVRCNCDKHNVKEIKNEVKYIISNCKCKHNLNIYLARLINYVSDAGEIDGDNFFSVKEFDMFNLEFKDYVAELLGKKLFPSPQKYRWVFCNLFTLGGLVFDPSGLIYKCEHFIGQKDFSVGNVVEGINYNNDMMDFLENEPHEACKLCKLFPICLGGCPANRNSLEFGQSCTCSMDGVIAQLQKYAKLTNGS